jgi:hypothetical protein
MPTFGIYGWHKELKNFIMMKCDTLELSFVQTKPQSNLKRISDIFIYVQSQEPNTFVTEPQA